MKLKNILISTLIIVFVLSSCGKSKDNESSTGDKLKIYTSFYAMYDFTQKICGDIADVNLLVPVGGSAHDWEPSSKEMAEMTSADMIIYSGHDMEHWIDTVKSALVDQEVKFVEASVGTSKRNSAENDEVNDPHVWLDPINAGIELENIKNAFIEIDYVNKDYYENRYEISLKEIVDLDNAYRETINAFDKKDIVVSHQAYGYLCSAYGLNQIAIEGILSDSEPTPAKMAEVIDLMKEKDIKYIFMEELSSTKIIDKIAQETDSKILVLNPYEGVSTQDIDSGADYFSVMYKNLENLKEVLND